MQLANIMLGIGGGRDNTVPKYGVTPSEIVILQAIHGEDAVHDVEPLDDEIERSSREELSRLRGIYGGAKDGNSNFIFNEIFPGAAARAFQTLDELALPEEFFKAQTRMKAKPAPAAKPGKKTKGKAEEPAPEAEADEEKDEIEDLPPAGESIFK
jgi:hypothetical protein